MTVLVKNGLPGALRINRRSPPVSILEVGMIGYPISGMFPVSHPGSGMSASETGGAHPAVGPRESLFDQQTVKRVMTAGLSSHTFNNDRMAGRRGLLCAEVSTIGETRGKGPVAIQSLTTLTREERKDSARADITNLTGMRGRRLSGASLSLLISGLSPGLRCQTPQLALQECSTVTGSVAGWGIPRVYIGWCIPGGMVGWYIGWCIPG